MCELLGISSGEWVDANELLQEFYSHSANHPNGWGLALLDEVYGAIEKEAAMALRSRYLQGRLGSKIRAKNLIAHIRLATVGKVDYDNCHPFTACDNCGRRWVFAHNGTVFDYPQLEPYQYRQRGTTDSERIMLFLTDKISDRQKELGRPLVPQERFLLLDREIRKMTPKNKLNFLFSDGEYLYVHSNFPGSLYRSEQNGTVTIATVPLKAGSWEQVPCARLCVYQNGQQVYEASEAGTEYVVDEEAVRLLYVDYSGL